MSNLDAGFRGEIFRKDHPQIIAQNRHLATLLPVRLEYDADGYLAGTVLQRNSTSGLYSKYDDSDSGSGLGVAKAVLLEEAPETDFPSSTGTALNRAIFGGEVYKSKLVGLDSNGEADLGAKTIIGADNVEVLKF